MLELMVVMGLFIGLITVVFAMWSTVWRRNIASLSSSCQQEARAALESAASDWVSANCLFASFQGSVGGVSLRVPALGQSGSSMLFACPESGATGSETYTVVALGDQDLSPADSNNPGARQITLLKVSQVRPPQADTPSSILPASLTGVRSKVFRTYHRAGQFLVTPTSSGLSLIMTLAYRYQPPRGPAVSGSYTLQCTRRMP